MDAVDRILSSDAPAPPPPPPAHPSWFWVSWSETKPDAHDDQILRFVRLIEDEFEVRAPEKQAQEVEAKRAAEKAAVDKAAARQAREAEAKQAVERKQQQMRRRRSRRERQRRSEKVLKEAMKVASLGYQTRTRAYKRLGTPRRRCVSKRMNE